MTLQIEAPPLLPAADSRSEQSARTWLDYLGALVALAACGFGLVGGRTADTERVDGYGLLPALGPLYWVGVALGAVATVILLRQMREGSGRFVALVPTTWLLVLHTGPHLAHDHLRFHTNWTHIGFMRLISETGTGDLFIDARFAWPGFFGTFVAPLGDLDQPVLEMVLRLWPTMVLIVSGILIGSLASRAYPKLPAIEPLSITCYFLLAWTGQDYWSPQSMGFILFLSIMVLVESGPLRTSPAWSASVPLLARFAAAGGNRPRSYNRSVFAVLVLLALAAVVSHPLAPFFICIGMLMLGVYARSVGWRLIVVVAIAFVIWFATMAEPWYSTQLPALIDELGSFFSNRDATTSARVAGSSSERLFVTRVRSAVGIGTIIAVLLIGITMAFDRFRGIRPVVPLAPLAGAPSIALVLGSYGGEIIFRVILFTLPLASILVARAILAISDRRMPIVVALFAVGMTVPFLLARFGNEAFEMTTAIDREVANAAYERAADDTLFVLDTGYTAFADRTIGRNSGTYAQLAIDPQALDEVLDLARDAGKSRVIVMVTPSMRQWRIHGLSSPPEDIDRTIAWLKELPESEVVYESGGGVAIEFLTGDAPSSSDSEGRIPTWVIQIVAVMVLLASPLAFSLNLGRPMGPVVPAVLSPGQQRRWRLEMYSTDPKLGGLVEDEADMPFPVKRVRSARGELAATAAPERLWTYPQLELDVTVDDPFDEAVLEGLFGDDHHVHFVSGSEALLRAGGAAKVRIRAIPFRT